MGESLSDYELTMQQIPDIDWDNSSKRNVSGLFVGSSADEDEDWLTANAAEVPPPKQPIEILERGFEMLVRTFDAFELNLAGKQPKGPSRGSKQDEETPVRNSAPVAQMNVQTRGRTSGHKGSTNGIHGVGNSVEGRLSARKMFPVTQRAKSPKGSSTYSPPSTKSKGSPVQAIKGANMIIERELATEKPKHCGSDNPQPVTQRSKSSKRSSTISPPDMSSKGSPVRTIKRAKMGIEKEFATEKPQQSVSDEPQLITHRPKLSKRSSTISPPSTSSKSSPVRTIKRAKTRIENDIPAEKPQHRGSDSPQAGAATNNKYVQSKSDNTVGIDTSNKIRAPKGHCADGPKMHANSSSPTKQEDSPISKYGSSPVKQTSPRDAQQSPKKVTKCEYQIDIAGYKPRLICAVNGPMPKQHFMNISSVLAAASSEKRRNPRDVDSADPYGQALYSDHRRWR